MKYRHYILFYIFILSGLSSCIENSKTSKAPIKIDAVCDSIRTIKMECIKLDSISTSYEIQTSIVNNEIIAVDPYLCYMYRFSADGHLKRRQLGQGHVKNETTIGKIAGHCFSADGKFILIGFQGETSVYDASGNLEKTVITDYNNRSKADLKTVDCYNNPIVYAKHYEDLICKEYNGQVYFNVDMFTPVYNIIDKQTDHIKNVYNIMAVDYSHQGELSLLIKGLPSYYQNDTKSKILFTGAHFDLSNKGDIYIAHEADSLVYVYDTNQELKSIYGRAASGIQQDYTKCNNIDDFRDNYMQERSSKGRYTSLEFVDETNLLFRTYQLSDKAENDRMQIYKEGVLIGNTNIPKGMHVIGYISPYYYSQIMSDEDEQSLKIYRFKL